MNETIPENEYDRATVRAYDSATVLLFELSAGVKLAIKSHDACAVDRRNGPPQLVLMPQEEEQADNES